MQSVVVPRIRNTLKKACPQACHYKKMESLYLVIVLYLLWQLQKRRRASRRYWVRYIFRNRLQQGDYHNLIREMRLTDDEEAHVRYLRVTRQTFDK